MNRQNLLIVAAITIFMALPLAAETNKKKPVFLAAKNAEETMNSLALPKNSDGYIDITVSKLSEMMRNKNFMLINVHIPYEGELPQTDLFMPFNQITDARSLEKLPEKDAPIVLYCRSGSMSTSAAKDLAELGYTNIMELDGGFNEWKASGYNFLRKD